MWDPDVEPRLLQNHFLQTLQWTTEAGSWIPQYLHAWSGKSCTIWPEKRAKNMLLTWNFERYPKIAQKITAKISRKMAKLTKKADKIPLQRYSNATLRFLINFSVCYPLSKCHLLLLRRRLRIANHRSFAHDWNSWWVPHLELRQQLWVSQPFWCCPGAGGHDGPMMTRRNLAAMQIKTFE